MKSRIFLSDSSACYPVLSFLYELISIVVKHIFQKKLFLPPDEVTSVYVYVRIYVYMYMYMCICAFVHIYIYTYIYIYNIYIYVCVCFINNG